MGLAEDDEVIEAFPADRADQSLRIPILHGWSLVGLGSQVTNRD
jgi:hypothetical protein